MSSRRTPQQEQHRIQIWQIQLSVSRVGHAALRVESNTEASGFEHVNVISTITHGNDLASSEPFFSRNGVQQLRLALTVDDRSFDTPGQHPIGNFQGIRERVVKDRVRL